MFNRRAEEAFVERLCQHLRARHAEVTAAFGDAALRARAIEGIGRARSHGLTYQSTITFFVALTFELTLDFDCHPAVQAALTEGEESPDERATKLPERVPDEVWRALRPVSR